MVHTGQDWMQDDANEEVDKEEQQVSHDDLHWSGKYLCY